MAFAREPELMRRHRTTARGVLPLLLLVAFCATAAAGTHEVGGPTVQPQKLVSGAPIVFPVIGKTWYSDDYGDLRGNGAHAGNDILVPRHSAVVAAEAGRVKWWLTSPRAGCMLYLYGASGTMYLYIHLNNDTTLKNDNRAGCEADTTYVAADGANVVAGETIAWSGDSGDADGTPHLHFEVHPKNGRDVNPFPYLNAAMRLLFPATTAPTVVLGLRGTPVSAGGGVLELALKSIRVWPGGRWTAIAGTIELAVPESAALDQKLVDQILAPQRRALAAVKKPLLVTVISAPVAATPDVQRGAPGSVEVERLRVGP